MENIAIEFLTKGQVALEGNFGFVLDKSDLKSASDKKIVRKATVALQNKICEQNTTPCCERLVILGFLTDHAFQPIVELASPLLYSSWPEPSCSRLTKMHGAKKTGLMPALSYFRWTGGILATSQYSWSEMGWDFLDHYICKGLEKDRSILVDIVDIRTEKTRRPRRDSCCWEMRTWLILQRSL